MHYFPMFVSINFCEVFGFSLFCDKGRTRETLRSSEFLFAAVMGEKDYEK